MTAARNLTDAAELMHTDDRGAELWRVVENDVQPCVWCGAGTWWRWLDEDAKNRGFACSVLCAQRRRARPAT